jgi:hypothetical protein
MLKELYTKQLKKLLYSIAAGYYILEIAGLIAGGSAAAEL